MRGRPDFNNHRIPSGVNISQSQAGGAFLEPSGAMLPPQRPTGHPRWLLVYVILFFFQPSVFERKKKRRSLWTHPFLSQIFRSMNSLLGQTQCSEVWAEHSILHKRGLKRASGEHEESTRERTRRGGSHRRLGVHHCLPVCRSGLSYASHCSCKEKAAVLPECPSLLPMAAINSPKTLIATAY